jgi:radical SAM protein with 4Fe4S-binding SPASM domain
MKDKDVTIYLKTTETCNLNCLHCFTNGTNGPKIFWDYQEVSNWIHRLYKAVPDVRSIHMEFHGGEPFLADVSTMQYVYDSSKNLWSNQSWGMTTNLVYKLDDEKINFIMGPLGARLGTSWDPDIRFSNPKQYDLWRKNIDILQKLKVDIKLFISVTKGTIAIEPIDLLEWVRDLGIKEMSLERLTHNGSAKKNPQIFPSNLEQDQWFLKMHHQSESFNARGWFDNEFFEDVYMKFEKSFNTAGTFCRDCEEKLFTLNADGSIAGCPNSAPEDYFGNISDPIEDLLFNPQRIKNIACERSRDPRCYSCEVFKYCGGDCHQLSWDSDICGAPKSLMLHLSGINKDKKVFMMKELK